jgi:hypothetical protein
MVYIKHAPRPYIKPHAMNKAQTLETAQALTILLMLYSRMPIKLVQRAPIMRANQMVKIPRAQDKAIPRAPMKETVLDEELRKVVFSKATWRIPHDPVQAFCQKVWIKQTTIKDRPGWIRPRADDIYNSKSIKGW